MNKRLWYREPARDWPEGLPIATGRLAAMVPRPRPRERPALNHEWLWVAGDSPRSDEALQAQFEACRAGRVNLLLDVPPDQHGLTTDENIAMLARLRKNAKTRLSRRDLGYVPTSLATYVRT